MPSQNIPNLLEQEDQDCMFAIELALSSVVPLVLKTAIELDILEIIAKAGNGARLSSIEIASHIPSINNPDAPLIIDRMLCLLASYSILTCSVETNSDDGSSNRVYGLAPVCKFLTRDEDGVSLAPFLTFCQSKNANYIWYHLKDAITEGGSPYYRAHGMTVFQCAQLDNNMFNSAMYSHTTVVMKKILEHYKGFEGLNQIVDVGGGFGANLKLIVSKYPKLKGINFDLPSVIQQAPYYEGVEHVEGDMFVSVPKGEAIFLKWILHDWGDDKCLKLLRNCYEVLPEAGKVIAIESIIPEKPDANTISKNIFIFDMTMFANNPGGKERTKKEFENLARAAGFASIKILCSAYSYSVIEFHKRI